MDSPIEDKPKVYWQSSTKDIDNIDINDIISDPSIDLPAKEKENRLGSAKQ